VFFIIILVYNFFESAYFGYDLVFNFYFGFHFFMRFFGLGFLFYGFLFWFLHRTFIGVVLLQLYSLFILVLIYVFF